MPRSWDAVLGALAERRAEVEKDRARARKNGLDVLLRAREQGRGELKPQEAAEFRKHIGEMRTLGAEIVGLDERVQDIRQERTGSIRRLWEDPEIPIEHIDSSPQAAWEAYCADVHRRAAELESAGVTEAEAAAHCRANPLHPSWPILAEQVIGDGLSWLEVQQLLAANPPSRGTRQ